MKYLRVLLAAIILATMSCERINDDRIPPVAVNISFVTIGDWNLYGVSGAGMYRYFIPQERQPAGYPYSALSSAGYGGILLVSDIHGNPCAYDLACPVEVKPSVRIRVLEDEMKAQCPVCHSVYDIFTNHGQPLSGPAFDDHYGLRKYLVVPGFNGEYMVIRR